jgi:transposase
MIYFGVDIGKRHHQAIALDAKGQPLGKSFPFDNSSEGFSQFAVLVATYQALDSVCVGMEATGHYWLNLYAFLSELGIELHVINPIQTEAMRNMHIRKTKTDTVDCRYIAEVIRMGDFSDISVCDDDLAELRQLCRYRVCLVDSVGAVKNQVIGLLDRVFPEYGSLFTDIFGATSKELLLKYTSPEQVMAVKTACLAKFLAKYSRGRFGRDKAEQILAAAKTSCGVKKGINAFVFQIRQMVMQIAFMEKQIEAVEANIEAIYGKTDCYLDTIDGVGNTLGAAILAEVGDISRFDSPKKLVAYAGIDPSVRQSGEFTGTENHMSKRGSVYLRRAIWNAATVAAQKNPILSAYYEKKRADGKDYMTAIGAVAHKLCFVIYAVLRDKKPYIPVA